PLDRRGARAPGRQAAAGAALVEELAPLLAGRDDVREPALLLRARAVGEQCRPDEIHADPADQLWCPGASELLGHDEMLDRTGAATAVFLGPRDTDPSAFGQLRLPVAAERDLRGQIIEVRREALPVFPREVLAQPRAHLGAQLRFGFRRLEVHSCRRVPAPALAS